MSQFLFQFHDDSGTYPYGLVKGNLLEAVKTVHKSIQFVDDSVINCEIYELSQNEWELCKFNSVNARVEFSTTSFNLYIFDK